MAVYGVARLGVARLNAFRLGYVLPALHLTINGVDRASASYVRVNELTATDYLNGQPNIATMRVWNFTPTKGHEVKIGVGSLDPAQLVFAGHIDVVTQVYEGNKPSNVAYDLRCTSYEWLLNRRKVTKRWTSTSATTIAQELISGFTSGFTSVNVASGLATLDEFTCTFEDVTDALDRLSKRIGGYWYIDAARDLHLFTAAEGAAHTINDSDSHSANAIVPTTELAGVRTRILVEGRGSQCLVPRVAGDTTVPVESQDWASDSGGTFVSGPQRITYTGRSSVAGTGTTVAGKSLSPGTPSAAVASGTSGNLSVGACQYKASFVTEQGESEVGSASSAATITDVAAPNGGPSGSATTGGSMAADDYTYYVTFVTDAGETNPFGPPFTVAVGGLNNAVDISNIPVSTDGRVTKRRIYRKRPTTDAFLVTTINDNSSTTFKDTLADASLGSTAAPWGQNTAGSGQVNVTNIPIGPAGTTARKLWRTEAGGSVFKYLATVTGNVTTNYTDNVPDGSLGAEAPDGSEVGARAGDTTLRVRDTSVVESTGGWVRIGEQTIFFTGRSVASGEGNLTGVPSSGTGSIAAGIRFGAAVLNAPFLKGVSGILYPMQAGDELNLLVQRDSGSAQVVMAGLVGGDGIHEEYIQDRRLSQDEAEARGDAKLEERKDPLVTVNYQTRDQTTRSGREVTFDLAAPTSLSGTFRIQQVTITGFDPLGRVCPLRRVVASSRRDDFEALLRILKRQAA